MQGFLKIFKGKGLLYQNKVSSHSLGFQSENAILFWTFMAISATWGHSSKKGHKGIHTKTKKNKRKKEKMSNLKTKLINVCNFLY